MRSIGTVSMGVRAPIVKKGDDLAQIVVDSIASAVENDNVVIKDHDVIGVTEAVLARTQGNYATTDQIATDVKSKFDGEVVGLILPILSRNRFSMLLKGIAKGVKKLVIQLSYPSDEVGNPLISLDKIDEKGIDPYVDVLTEKEFRDLFGHQALWHLLHLISRGPIGRWSEQSMLSSFLMVIQFQPLTRMETEDCRSH